MKIRSLSLIFPLVLFLSACSTTNVLLDPESLYPTALTKCADEPIVPSRPAPDQPRTEKDKATYTKNLHDAYLDCHDTVAGWAERRQQYVQQYSQQTDGLFAGLWKSVTN